MGRIKVKVNAVKGLRGQIVGASNMVGGSKDRVRTLRGQIDGKILARNNINARLQNVANVIEDAEKRMRKVERVVYNGAEAYRLTDVRINQMKKQMLGVGKKHRGIVGWSVPVESNVKKKKINKKEKGKNSSNKKEEEKNFFEKIFLSNYETGDAKYAGAVSATGEILGLKTNGKAKGDLFGYSASWKGDSSFSVEYDKNGKIKKDSLDIGMYRKGEVEAHAASGEVSGSVGNLGGKVSGTVGSVGATGKVGFSLIENGKFSPRAEVGAEASATAAKGDAEVKFGDEQFNKHVKAEGEVLSANASAKAGAGRITVEDKKGKQITTWGAEAEVAAEAYLAEGSIKGGYTILGIDIDVGVEGKAGGGGAKAGGRVTAAGAEGEIGLGLGVGAGIKVSVDWSDFSLFK